MKQLPVSSREGPIRAGTVSVVTTAQSLQKNHSCKP